jgi:hypothetical protein
MNHTLQTRPHGGSRSQQQRPQPDPSLRIGDAERAHASSQLGQAFTLGYLSIAEYQNRLDQALQACTGADLSRLTADLPLFSPDRADPGRQAAHQAAALRGVRIHLSLYLLAAVAALSVWLTFALTLGAWYFWPIWPLLGGAAGVLSHAISARMCRRASSTPGIRG